jgi:hypothetical protein
MREGTVGKKKKAKAGKGAPLMESGLLQCMQALDKQIAREMQRSPEEREAHGVQKWEPYNTRIERVVTLLLNELGDENLTLDSVFVLAQSLSKTLSIMIDDLGEEGLGNVRSMYCLKACEALSFDTERALNVLRGSGSEQLN